MKNQNEKPITTLCIKLNCGEKLDERVIRLEKGWRLRFLRGDKTIGIKIKVLIRGIYSKSEFLFDAKNTIADLETRDYHEFVCDDIGTFKYEFYSDIPDDSSLLGYGYFCVVPEWKIYGTGKLLKLNGLRVITYLSKLLGPLVDWEDRILIAKESGYNMIHFTPIQKLGVSNSSYSIAEYDTVNPVFDADILDVEKFVKKMEKEWSILSIQDVVWNHAAKNAEWLWKNPDCAYNCLNSKHLRPAFVFDRALVHFGREISNGEWRENGLPEVIDSNEHLNTLKRVLQEQIIPSLSLHEFFQADIGACLAKFCKHFDAYSPKEYGDSATQSLKIIQDPEYRRLKSSVDVSLAVKLFKTCDSNESDYKNSCEKRFIAELERLNGQIYDEVTRHCQVAIDAILGHVHYERVSDSGPRKGRISEQNPLLTHYFVLRTDLEAASKGWKEDEKLAFDPETASYLMACNGWVMNADPLSNFAEHPSFVYFKRELVCWGDSIKLNYRQRPEDCPFLWDYMRKYTEQCARTFHGFRIDNCHSTPIHVAEYFLGAAREIRKDLYVIAELFTQSKEKDNLFVNKLGITSLIREAQNAPDSHEQGRFVYFYGGEPVGAFWPKATRAAPSSGVAHAIFFDQTHDNPSPFTKRTAYDFIPTAAVCAMSYCATGSVQGYDFFVPHNIDVVREKRLYLKWSEISSNERFLRMVKARRLLNELHEKMADDGFTEIFVDQVNEDIVAITRHNPHTRESYLLIAHCCFNSFKWTANCRPVSISDDIEAVVFELMTTETQIDEQKEELNNNRIIGLPNFDVKVFEQVFVERTNTVSIHNGNTINLTPFPSGSVIALKIKPKLATINACRAIEDAFYSNSIRQGIAPVLEGLDLEAFNFLFFRCANEESSESGTRPYEVPNFGELVYCGLQGIQSILQKIHTHNDLGHPFCANLRDGTWICDYLVGRLKTQPNLKNLAKVFEKYLKLLKDLPGFLRPCYFELIFSEIYAESRRVLVEKIFSKAKLSNIEFSEHLAISSVSFLAHIKSANLPTIYNEKVPLSLAAGLPHFSVEIWRNWGRDTFIALPGCLLLTGRFEEAKQIILAYAGTLRHGLIPNLLAEGKTPRYNCRDSVWFWLVAILRYIELSPDKDSSILKEPVVRLYPKDDAIYGEASKIEPLHDTMYEALQRHMNGISFRERDAGQRIDSVMTSEGFNVSAYIDQETGLIFGGNRWNCGTWMDKMGSSHKAGNAGEPATPRDGAAVELQGLAYYTARSLDRLSKSGVFPFPELKSENSCWTWDEWAQKLQRSFSEHFVVTDSSTEQYVNRRNIIKDCYKSSLGYTDYQLRPNFCISLDISPDILAPEIAWRALEIAGEVLASNAPYGIATLDPGDLAYKPFYDNSDDGFDKSTAKGWNYHQGPEWLWVAGCYMSAKLKVSKLLSLKMRNMDLFQKTQTEVRERIYKLLNLLNENVWASLPELTNRGGAPCPHSCPAQAWSVGCVLETLYNFEQCTSEKFEESLSN